MATNKPRCPFEFKQFCGAQCAWYNSSAERCQMLVEVNELASIAGRLTSSVNETNRTLTSLVEPLRGLVNKEKRNELSM